MPDDAAPPAARLLVEFVNTREPQTDHEALPTPADLTAWLAAHVHPDCKAPTRPSLTERDLVTVLQVREGLRAVLGEHAGRAPAPDSNHQLNNALRQAPVSIKLNANGCGLEPVNNDALTKSLAPILNAIQDCQHDVAWLRLKACCRDTCQWAYYDNSRNSSRRWCSMRGCGNYIKMRRRNQPS